MVLTVSENKEHLFDIKTFRELKDTGVQNNLILLKVKFLLAFYDTEDRSKNQQVFSFEECGISTK